MHVQVATVFGRPKWDKIFTDIKQKHPGKRVGVFVCGPVVSASTARPRAQVPFHGAGCTLSQSNYLYWAAV